MPDRTKRPCGKPGCNNLGSGRYCEAHANQPELQRRAFDEKRSADPLRKLYGSPRWKHTSRTVLLRDPICKDCGIEFSSNCDHIIPARIYVAQHGGDTEFFFDENNLQGLGQACHSRKTARECGFAGAAF